MVLINPEQLQGVSYDLSLDKYFIQPAGYSKRWFNPAEMRFQCEMIVSSEYLLYPQKRVLASTIEKAGSKSLDITSKIFAKSSWARHGLEVCSCAGYGDPFYYNHWTLEIFNKNEYPVLLQAGMIITQISFEGVSGCDKNYTSKYNNDGQDKVFTHNERFEMMTPKFIKKIRMEASDEQV